MNKSLAEIWSNCLAIIKDNLNPVSFQTWFAPIKPLKVKDNVITIQVPSHFFYEYIEENFVDLISASIKQGFRNDAVLEYSVVVDKKNSMTLPQVSPQRQNANVNQTQSAFVNPASKPAEIKNPFVIPGLQKIKINSQLNPNFTMENFVEGDCNRLGRSAALQISQQPGTTPFNPFLIYGGSGLGKTHLAQAIGNSVQTMFPEKVVLYVPANRFQEQYVESVRNNTRNDFMHFYQMIDVLIIDDVQDFAGKNATQETFFHIFNQLHQSGKQLILTSDRPPVELQGLNTRLLTRFKWGLTADLTAPDFPTRLEILKNKAYRNGLKLENEILVYMAQNVVSSIRELEGSLVSIMAQSVFTKRTITLDLVQSMISNLTCKPKHEYHIDFIKQTVCEAFNINPDVLKTNSRKREIVQARHLTMYFCKSLTTATVKTIGMEVGGKDHSTVLHAIKTVENLLKTDQNFMNLYSDIKAKLKY